MQRVRCILLMMASKTTAGSGAKPMVLKLRADGMTYRAIAAACGISVQRVHQILKAHREQQEKTA